MSLSITPVSILTFSLVVEIPTVSGVGWKCFCVISSNSTNWLLPVAALLTLVLPK